MKLTGIIALAKNRVIGKNNDLPWGRTYKEDLKFFKEKTTGGHVIMGRKTYDGMGVPHLRNRTLWVLTRENKYGWIQLFNDQIGAQTNIVTNTSHLPDLDYFVAGGLTVYQELMPKIDEFFVTYLNQEYEGDAIMPAFEEHFQNSESVLVTPEFEIKRLWKNPQPAS
jgi:dihydrofolate reductase